MIRRLSAMLLGSLVAAALGCTGNSQGTSTASGPTSVTVTPSSTTVVLGATQLLSAVVTGGSNTSLNWSVNPTGLGTITPDGLYTAPAILPQSTAVTVTATSQADSTKSGSAILTIASDVAVTLQATPSGAASIAFNEVLTVAALVTSSGNPDPSMTWTVNGVTNGNSALGTITTSGLTVTYTAPGSPAQVSIKATSVADPSKSASLPFSIQALSGGTPSNTAPLPLTPIQIPTAGLDTTAAVQVQFSNGLGFVVTESPIRVTADATVVVTIPLYVTPSSGQIGPGTVSLVLTQGNQSTAPMTLNIQDLPPVSAYGTQLGDISHTFLDFEAMMLARKINEFQAYQMLPGNTVDTSQAQSTLNTLLNDVIKARSDVDQVSLNNSIVISPGSLPDGTPIQFDQNSVDIMDRMIGLYLTEWGPIILPSTPSSVLRVSSRLARVLLPFRLSGEPQSRFPTLLHGPERVRALTDWKLQSRLSSANASSIQNVISYLKGAANLSGIAQTLQSYQDTKNSVTGASPLDMGLAMGGGLSGLVGLADAAGKSLVPAKVSTAFGALLASLSLLQDLGNELGDLGFIMYASRYGGDPTVLRDAQKDLNDNATKAVTDTVETELNLLEAGGAYKASSFGPDVLAALESNSGQIALQSSYFINHVAAIAATGEYDQVLQAALTAAAETVNPFPAATEGIAQLVGNVIVPTNQGVGAPLSGIELSSNGTTLNTLADSIGNYQSFLPLQASPFDYASTDVTIVDPISQSILGSEVVDLSNLTTATPLQIPTLQGLSCSNIDFDGDDPDCD
jgi:hypothetical protein